MVSLPILTGYDVAVLDGFRWIPDRRCDSKSIRIRPLDHGDAQRYTHCSEPFIISIDAARSLYSLGAATTRSWWYKLA